MLFEYKPAGSRPREPNNVIQDDLQMLKNQISKTALNSSYSTGQFIKQSQKHTKTESKQMHH